LLPVGDLEVHGIVERDYSKSDGHHQMPLEYPPGATNRPAATGENPLSQALNATSETFTDLGAEWLDRIEAVIERYPWPTLLLALGLGYVIARRMR
jgi:hypothetical protein